MYDSLFSPLALGGITLRNRVAAVLPESFSELSAEKLKILVTKLAEGGAGLICISAARKKSSFELKALCNAAHLNGAYIFAVLPEIKSMIFAPRALFCGFDGLFIRHGEGLRLMGHADVLMSDADDLSPGLADKLIASGACSVTALTRSLLADPDLCRKLRRGDIDDVRPCLGCRGGCSGNTCACNPGLFYPLPERTDAPCRMAVIGGGAAAMSFALTAGERGHTVDIFESETRLGGQMLNYSAAKDHLCWLTRRLCRLKNVQIFTGAAFRGGYDTVVCASDARPLPLPESHDCAPIPVYGAYDCLSRDFDLAPFWGKRLAVVGSDAASELYERIEKSGMARSVTLIKNAEPLRFEGESLLFKTKNADFSAPLVFAVSCDALILETKLSPSGDYYRGSIFARRVFYIGGAVAVSDIFSDIRAGYELALQI